ncbi:interleukin-7 receptor subunit alpha-like [Eleutherodactylus coqui]|uniref:interleukin-7 receptor subunit alpha-like n=1 Tax=Eleutherodactylus coqui TaxID=57060 RepID=UPI003461E827
MQKRLRVKTWILLNMVLAGAKRPEAPEKDLHALGARNESKPWTENKHVTFHVFLEEYNVCLVWGKSEQCKTFNIKDIAIPDSPTNITIWYNKQSKEYEFDIFLSYEDHDYLTDRLYHELVLRKEGTQWPNCKDETPNSGGHKVCFQNLKDSFYVPKRNLEYSTKFEARARSIPTGGYFHGSWSPWSPISTFRTEDTEASVYNTGGYLVAYISIPFFLLVAVILIAVFWKRIKPFIWPEIPDHKKTLEKFCNKPKQNFHTSFNPDYCESIPINKIDYIKAQEIPDDEHEIGTADSSIEKPACHINLSPAEGSRGPPTNANNSGQCKNLADNGENKLENPLNFGIVTLLPGNDVSEKCNPSTDSNGMMSAAVKHPGNGLKGLCWEDIYIAMSAFKTPSSAVKQVPKNNI